MEAIITAPNRKDLIIATRALDRVLLWNYFLVPQWHIREDRIVWWDKFGKPKKKQRYKVKKKSKAQTARQLGLAPVISSNIFRVWGLVAETRKI